MGNKINPVGFRLGVNKVPSAHWYASPKEYPRLLAEDELIRAVGPLHFAGEHTAGVHYATMDGALRSGRRAAEEIMARE